ncbi:MAG: UpxY family transcription antiterminator [Candidatus Cryptobacteroides sp.]
MKEEDSVWFAMRVTYKREFLAKKLLDDEGIENYIPKRWIIDRKNRKKVLVPAIRNLIFVYAKPSVIQNFKTGTGITFLQYMVDKRSGQKIIVPEEQMRQFIAVTAEYDESLLFFKPEELNLSKGTRVRVKGGPMEGREGVFVRVKGARDRRLVIQIEGVIAVAVASIHPDLIQVLPDRNENEL